MFANGKSIQVWPVQKDDLYQNTIDCRQIDVQQKITDLLTAGYQIYDVAANNGFNALIAATSGNRICVWKSAGSTSYTLYSTELASNGTNVIVNATLNNMNLVTAVRDCKLTCTASSGLFANKAEFYGGDWYLASWTTGSNVKFTNCDVYAYSSEVYIPDPTFDYCNVYFKRSGTIAYSTYKQNKDTRFVNMTTAGSTTSTLQFNYAYSTDSDWFLRCTAVDWQNTGTFVLNSTTSRTFNFTGLKIENSNLAMANLYSTEGSKIYYEGQDLVLSGSNTANAWSLLGSANISASSGQYPAMAVDSNGIPYVAFQDNANSDKASCYKYGSTGWSVVGYVGFSTGTASNLSIAISTDNDIVVGFIDDSSKASAYYLSAAASSWNLLGTPKYTDLITSNKIDYSYTYSATSELNKKMFISIALSSDTPGQVKIYRYNYTDSTGWTLDYNYAVSGYTMCDIDLPDVFISSSSKYKISTRSSSGWLWPTSINTGTINNMSGYYDGSTSHKIILQLNSSLSYLYYATDTTGGVLSTISTGTANYISALYVNSAPYVAIQDTTGKATVYKYISANSSWNLVGTAQFSTDSVSRVALASFGNTPYLAVEELASQGIAAYTFGETVVNSNINYSFEKLETDVFDGEYSLDITNIQSTGNYITQNCFIRPVFNIVDTVVGRFIRNSYQIDLNPRWNPPVDDVLKETNADTIWVVKRGDAENYLNGKIIKNLQLLNADLSDYTYNSNDNLIIIANNAQKGNAVLELYNNKIKGTIFSDWYLDTSYTITDVFNLLEVSEISDLHNIVSSTKLADGPLESGTITFNSIDNEVTV